MAQRLQCKRPPAVILIVTGEGGLWGVTWTEADAAQRAGLDLLI